MKWIVPVKRRDGAGRVAPVRPSCGLDHGGSQIPDVVINRLPVYVRALTILQAEGREVVSSLELGRELGVTPAQIRKDLSYFGRFGKQGRGYNVQQLIDRLRAILGLDREWRLALVGVGRLGQAILGYGGFSPQGFAVVRAFDTDPAQIGRRLDSVTVEDLGGNNPTTMRPTVDLPQPLSPTRPTISPSPIVRLTSSTAWTISSR